MGNRVFTTYGDAARRAGAIATALRRRHRLAAGDRVVLAAKNHPSYLEALFGIWWSGLVAVPVNAKLHPSEIAWIIGDAQARVAFISDDLTASLGSVAMPGVEMVYLAGGDYEAMLREGPAEPSEARGDDVAWLFYTSGTTGRPKGAMLTHRNLAAMTLGYLADVDPTAPGDAIFHAAPMSHGSGLYMLPHVCRMAVNAVPESGGFDPAEVGAFLGGQPRTSMFLAPTMIRRLVDADVDVKPGAIRTMVWGGAPMHAPDVIRALDRFGPCLAQIYGQGETPMTITVLSREDVADRSHPRWPRRLASAGYSSSIVEVRVANPDGAAGDPGEVLVRGDTVMAGYWNNPEATARALRDGWLHTGDIGLFDDDGCLTLLDRSKDVIISGGSNIYPREVEEVLAEHPRVREVAVLGRRDPEWGEIVVAYVVGDCEPGDLDRLCLSRIARFKRPKDYVFVDALPKNSTGKILKRELQQRDAARVGSGVAGGGRDR